MMTAAINVKMCREEMAKTLLISSSKHVFNVSNTVSSFVMAMDVW